MDWLRNLVLFLTAVGFFQWIIPSGTFEKYIKFIISIITLAVILSPLQGEAVLSASLELPQGAVAQEGYEEMTDQVEQIQFYQLQTVLEDRIEREVRTVLKHDFPGITVEDLEVYIEQGSLYDQTDVPCRITVTISDPGVSDEIQDRLHLVLDLPDAAIHVKGKESNYE